MVSQDHLTDAGTELGRRASATPPGMAYLVGTGPAGATCGGCRFFMGATPKSGLRKGGLQPGRCREFIRMMMGKGYSNAPVYHVPPETAACRHFEAKPEPAPKASSATE